MKMEVKPIPVKVIDATNSPDGKIYIRETQGKFQRARQYFSGFLFLLFLILPWLEWQDRQAILLSISEQKFYFFNITIWPQDFTLLAGGLIFSAFMLFLITNLYGRVWCGFTCPQTVWTLIFVWFENKIEGSANQRKKLDQAPWSLKKASLRLTKHSAWLLIAFVSGVTFIGYFLPINTLLADVVSFEVSFWQGFWVWFFVACTYVNAGLMREKMCLHCCPYSRFQSAMFDANTKTITYDAARGEGRGPRKRNKTQAELKQAGLGDCIDCNLCVQVCPTGIDIRDGLQYECINCGLCADACNQTMANFGYEQGLIRFASEGSLQGQAAKPSRLRVWGYGIVATLIASATIIQSINLKPLELNVLRDRSELFRLNNEGWVENTYTVKMLNKTQYTQQYRLVINSDQPLTLLNSPDVTLAPGEMLSLPLTLQADPYQLATSRVTFTLTANEVAIKPNASVERVAVDELNQQQSQPLVFFSQG